MSGMKKGNIDGKMVEIVTREEYYAHPSLYPNNYTAFDFGGDFIYPIRGKLDTRPGSYITPRSPFIKQVEPTVDQYQDYSRSNITDFNDATKMSEIIHKQNELISRERSILESADNIFIPPIKPNDSAEMVGMKQVMKAKNCDFDKYDHRFGKKNFQNEKRLFDRDSMTLSKIRKICKAVDVKCTMTFQDAAPNVPNPMNTVITVDITGGEDMEDDE